MEWPAGVNVVSLASSLSFSESVHAILDSLTRRRLVEHDLILATLVETREAMLLNPIGCKVRWGLKE